MFEGVDLTVIRLVSLVSRTFVGEVSRILFVDLVICMSLECRHVELYRRDCEGEYECPNLNALITGELYF